MPKSILNVLPGICLFIIVKTFGLPAAPLALVLESISLYLKRQNTSRYWRRCAYQGVFSAAGLISGFLLCRPSATPAALGIAALILTLLIYIAVFLLLCALISAPQKR